MVTIVTYSGGCLLLFYKNYIVYQFFTCLYDQSLRLLSYHQALLLYTLWFLRYNVAKCIARGLFTKLFTCFYNQSYRLLSCQQVSLLYTFWFLRWLNVLPEAVYCCFTRTTLFTTMFTAVIVVCSLKSMCIQSFVVV